MQFHKTLLDQNNQLADGSGEAVAAAAQVVRVWEGMDSEGSGGAASAQPMPQLRDLPAFRVCFTSQVGTSSHGTGSIAR